MAQSPLLPSTNGGATPIYALRAQEWESWIAARPESLRRLAAAHDFRAQKGRLLLAPATDGSIERVLFGLGENAGPAQFGTLGQHLPAGVYAIAWAPREFDPTVLAEAWAMGAYEFDRYRPRRRGMPQLVCPEGCDEAEALRVFNAVWFARDLINTPANDMGPEALHAAAEAAARADGAEIEVSVGDALLKDGYPMIHAVGRAASDAPRIVRITWGEPGRPRIALVGKGVTFDSGGLDIKPSSGMRLMKKDMGGAAIALALGRLVMQAGLRVQLEIVLPIVENAISANAFRPGDVVMTRKGLSVEVDNTDAEGRLILADALTRACEDKPELVLDFATLTGAARVALGPEITPFYTDDDALAADLAQAGQDVADAVWRMPLWNGYESDMDSPIAHLKNTGDNGMAGSIYGALFLRRFVDAPLWAHFDTYAWSPKDRPARPAGADTQGLRAAWRMLRTRYGAR